MWFFFTSIVTTSLPRGQYNESGHPPLKFSITRCLRLTALSALTSGCAICPVTMFMSAPSGWEAYSNGSMQTSSVARRLWRSAWYVCCMLYFCIILFCLKLRGAWSPCYSGYADGHRFHIYVSIINTEWVMAILMISSCRGGHIWFCFNWEGAWCP